MIPTTLPAYLSNGVIGLSVRTIPCIRGISTLSGYVGRHPVAQVEAAAYVPYPIAFDIRLNQVSLLQTLLGVEFQKQFYDFGRGELQTEFIFRTDDATAVVKVLTFCSRSLPSVVAQQISVSVDRQCQARVTVSVDTSEIPGRFLERNTSTPGAKGTDDEAVDGSLHWESSGGLSSCGIAYVSQFSGKAEKSRDIFSEGLPLATHYSFDAQPGRQYTVCQMTALVPGSEHRQPHQQSVRLAAEAKRRGFERIQEENSSLWKEIWRGRFNLVGASSRWQAIADAAFYYLHASVHECSASSTSIFGLAQWPNFHYYYGHIMWDIETFSIPTLAFTAPNCAKTMLMYRASRLAAAISNAKLWGYRGAQFPWESSMRWGEEVSPAGGGAAAVEHHINFDVALAFARYVHATGDDSFRRHYEWPVLDLVAQWIESRVIQTDNGFSLCEVNGMGERKDPANNNAYTNMGAILVLREAIVGAHRQNIEVPAIWTKIEKGLCIPSDRSSKAIISHEGFTPDEELGATPEPAAGLFPLNFATTREVEYATFRYYLRLADGYIGTPMLSAFYGIWAARSGDRGMSAELFERGYAEFIQEPFWETDEVSDKKMPDYPRVGPFMANISGFLLACLCGLTGMRPSDSKPEEWFERKIVMPANWEGIEIERIFVRQKNKKLIANHGDERGQLIG